MMLMMIMQVEKQKSDAVSQCQRAAAERDEAVQGNKFLQSKLKEAEIAMKELAQNVTLELQSLYDERKMMNAQVAELQTALQGHQQVPNYL